MREKPTLDSHHPIWYKEEVLTFGQVVQEGGIIHQRKWVVPPFYKEV